MEINERRGVGQAREFKQNGARASAAVGHV